MATITVKIDLRSFEEVNMAIKYSSLLKEENPEIKHFEIPFTVCMSSENSKPDPFNDDVFLRFADSDTITHKISRYHTERKFLYISIETKQDCLLKGTAITSYNPDSSRHLLINNRPGSTAKISLGRSEFRQLSYEPGKKDAYIDMLHKKDMANVNFCDLSRFGETLIDKDVRDRAIRERINAV